MKGNLSKPFSGRRGIDPYGRRFLLDPTPAAFNHFFSGFHGAAFIRMSDHVAFGAGPDGSIDHDSVAQAFGLCGNEEYRGYAAMSGGAQIEVWTDAEDAELMSADEIAHAERCRLTALSCPILSGIPGDRQLVIFSKEHGQPILEQGLTSCVCQHQGTW